MCHSLLSCNISAGSGNRS
ncbi:hypothetical protein [Klebsiella pneumoniae]